jgi:beta-amylase
MLKKHAVILKLVCYGPEFTVHEKDDDEAFADPEGLTWQVVEMFQASLPACQNVPRLSFPRLISVHIKKKKLQLHTQVINAAWDQGLPLCIESALPCRNGEAYSRILDTAKPRDDPDRHHAAFFAYRQQQQPPLREACLSELCTFVKCMHG